MKMAKTFNEWHDTEIAQLRALVLDGMSSDEIARKIGRSLSSVKAARSRYNALSGWRTGPRGHTGRSCAAWTPEDVQKVREMALAGIPDFEIGAALGRSGGAISSFRSRNSIGSLAPSWVRVPGHKKQAIIELRLNTVEAVMKLRPLSPTEHDMKVRIAASIAHAIDFKRAGHTHGQGEMNITPDGRINAAPTSYAMPMSYVGSSAAMCSD